MPWALCSHDEEAAKAIIAGMEWLGVRHDGEIVRQSANKQRHKEVAEQLLSAGKAFKCYCSKEELEALRAEAEKNKVPFRYPGTCRAPGFVAPEGVEPVCRICTEQEGSTGWDDQVQGRIDFPNKVSSPHWISPAKETSIAGFLRPGAGLHLPPQQGFPKSRKETY